MVDAQQPRAAGCLIAVASGTLDRFESDVLDPDVAEPTGAVSGLRGVLAAPAVSTK